MMPRPPQCDNDNCDYDETGWHHAPECPADADNGDTPWGSNPALDAAREDGFTSVFIPRQTAQRRAAA
jgi:hypothetical protein